MKWPGHRDVRTQFVGVCTVYCFIEGDKFSTIKCKKSLMVTIYCFCWELEQPIRALSIWIVGPGLRVALIISKHHTYYCTTV